MVISCVGDIIVWNHVGFDPRRFDFAVVFIMEINVDHFGVGGYPLSPNVFLIQRMIVADDEAQCDFH